MGKILMALVIFGVLGVMLSEGNAPASRVAAADCDALNNVEALICESAQLKAWNRKMIDLFRQALRLQNKSPTLLDNQKRWRRERDSRCDLKSRTQSEECLLRRTKERVAGLVALIKANGADPEDDSDWVSVRTTEHAASPNENKPAQSEWPTQGWAVANGPNRGLYNLPGAIVCPDLRTLQMLERLIGRHQADLLRSRLTHGQSEIISRQMPKPVPSAFGCAIIPNGTPIYIERIAMRFVAIVRAKVDGADVTGITMTEMLKKRAISSSPARPERTLTQTDEASFIALDLLAGEVNVRDVDSLTNAIGSYSNRTQSVASDAGRDAFVALSVCGSRAAKQGASSAERTLRTICSSEYREQFAHCVAAGETHRACAAGGLWAVTMGIQAYDKYCRNASPKDAGEIQCP